MAFGTYNGTVSNPLGQGSGLNPDSVLAPDAALVPHGAAPNVTNTRVKTWLNGAEKTFAFPYTPVVQEEAWLLDALGYTAG